MMKKLYWYLVSEYLIMMQETANDMNQERANDDMIIAMLSVFSYMGLQ